MKALYNSLLTLSAIVLLFASQACKTGCVQGSGKEITDKRQVAEFTKLDIAGSLILRWCRTALTR